MFLLVDNAQGKALLRKGTKDIATDKSPRKSFLFFTTFETGGTGRAQPPIWLGGLL